MTLARHKSLPVTTRSFIVAIIALLAFATVSSASASDTAQPIRLSIKPVGVSGSYFDLTLQPGQSQLLSVELGNHGDLPVEARTYAADSYTIVNGGFGARLADEQASSTTLWVSYEPETIELQPGTAILRPFTISVPEDTRPGEYITSIAIQNAVPTGGDGEGVVVRQVMRQVVAIAVTVPGERAPALAIGGGVHKDVASASVIAVDVQNTGNVRLKPIAALELFDASGAQFDSKSVQFGSFYAGTSTRAEFTFRERLPAGDYTAVVTLTDPGEGIVVSTTEPIVLQVAEREEQAAAPVAEADQDGTSPALAVAPSSSQPWGLVAVAVGATLAVVAVAALLALVIYRRRADMRPALAVAVPEPVVGRATLPDEAVVVDEPARRMPVRRLVPPGME